MQDYVTEQSIPAWSRLNDSLSSTSYLNTHYKGRTSLSHKTTMLHYCPITLISHNYMQPQLLGKLNKKKRANLKYENLRGDNKL